MEDSALSVRKGITYVMLCPEGEYVAKSWIGLGWSVLRHRLWHLWKHRRWMD